MKITTKQVRTRKEKISLTNNQIKDLLETIEEENKNHSKRNKLIARTWLATGLRVSEMANFQIQWLMKADFCYIYVLQNDKPYAFKPKYGSSRKIPIPDKLYKDLRKHIGSKSVGYVFMPQTKNPYARFHEKYLISLFNGYFKETKSIARNLGSHTFRRTFASHLEKNSVPLSKISEYLGHANISTTITYLKQIKSSDHSEIIKSDYLKNILKY